MADDGETVEAGSRYKLAVSRTDRDNFADAMLMRFAELSVEPEDQPPTPGVLLYMDGEATAEQGQAVLELVAQGTDSLDHLGKLLAMIAEAILQAADQVGPEEDGT